jgi:6,7-dimethyl-8-ribityllumazine synthase
VRHPGETTHYDTVANESARGLMQLAMTHRLAVGNGILTVENDEQVWARARIGEMNKGEQRGCGAQDDRGKTETDKGEGG